MMRSRSRALIAALVILSLVLSTTAVLAGELASPLKKKLPPGVTSISYGGETVTFTTAVILRVEFSMSGSPTAPTIKIKATAVSGAGNWATGNAAITVEIYWDDQGQELYNGGPPIDTWTGEIQGEGGWTEK